MNCYVKYETGELSPRKQVLMQDLLDNGIGTQYELNETGNGYGYFMVWELTPAECTTISKFETALESIAD